MEATGKLSNQLVVFFNRTYPVKQLIDKFQSRNSLLNHQ